MRKLILHKFLLLATASVTLLQSCKDDSDLLAAPPVPDQSFSQEFDSTASVVAQGWKMVNNSYPLGNAAGNWQQGGALNPLFAPYSQQGTFAGFLAATYESTSDATGVISNWMISPAITMQNGDKIIFYTRAQLLPTVGVAGDSTDYGNRLQVRITRRNDAEFSLGSVKALWEWLFTPSPNVAQDDPGSFDYVLLDINPEQFEWHKNASSTPQPGTFKPYTDITNLKAYPPNWTRFEATVSGLTAPTRGRFALRYYVEGGGNNGLATAVGIDKLSYISISRR
jgi:hypothetical protein